MKLIRSALIVTVIAGLTGCGDNGLQPQKHFEAALENTSTAPSLVRIDLIEGGTTSTQCVYANDLIRALMVERGLRNAQGYDEALKGARANKLHRFAFRRQAALKELGLAYVEPERRQACEIIARGRPAFQDDMSGEIREGSPMGNL